MSKHDKRLKRARRKAERARRSSATTHGAAALAAAAVIAAGTSAYAEPIRYNNPDGGGHFDWAAPLGNNSNWLDITQDAGAQPGVADGPSSLRHQFFDDVAYGFGQVGRVASGVNVAVNYVSYLNLLDGLASGDLIGAGGLAWNSYGYATNAYYGLEAFPEGVPTYLGMRFNVGSGNQYGWIGVTRSGNTLDAFAWGYETTPDTPIAAGVPEPGTLAMLALGAVGVLRRRR